MGKLRVCRCLWNWAILLGTEASLQKFTRHFCSTVNRPATELWQKSHFVVTGKYWCLSKLWQVLVKNQKWWILMTSITRVADWGRDVSACCTVCSYSYTNNDWHLGHYWKLFPLSWGNIALHRRADNNSLYLLCYIS